MSLSSIHHFPRPSVGFFLEFRAHVFFLFRPFNTSLVLFPIDSPLHHHPTSFAMSVPTKQWGISAPISTALPEPKDNEKTAELVEELKRENNYEPQEETKKRMATLSLLSRVTQEFIREVSRRQRLPAAQIDQFGGKIVPYGSYRLGVFGPGEYSPPRAPHPSTDSLGSDIDTLAIAPRHITRDDFFEYYPTLLQRMAGPGAVSSLTAVPSSFVPIIKLVLNGIEIDLIFASIPSLATIPKDLSLSENALLTGMDNQTVKSITGPRVTDEILSLVPEQKTFRTALRAIKLWAQRRAIYANIVGYPGGVAWAMLVARVCQLYPHAVGATIVDKFFLVIKDWRWPAPVMLKDIEPVKNPEQNKHLKVWNPTLYPGDRHNIMPIITPAFPSMCATYNISKSGKTVILKELERGSVITTRIFAGKAQWSDLFQKHSFFTADHKYYLAVTASARNADEAKSWAGLVESKVRIFIQRLEGVPNITLARPFTKGFKRVHGCENEAQIREAQKGSIKYKAEETKTVESTDPELVTNGAGAAVPSAQNGASSVVQESHTVYTYTFYIGIDAVPKASLNLVPAFTSFKNICEEADLFRRDVHFLTLASFKK